MLDLDIPGWFHPSRLTTDRQTVWGEALMEVSCMLQRVVIWSAFCSVVLLGTPAQAGGGSHPGPYLVPESQVSAEKAPTDKASNTAEPKTQPTFSRLPVIHQFAQLFSFTKEHLIGK